MMRISTELLVVVLGLPITGGYFIYISYYIDRAGSRGRQETKCDGMTGIHNHSTVYMILLYGAPGMNGITVWTIECRCLFGAIESD